MAFGLSDTGKAAVDGFLAGAPAIVAQLQAAGMTDAAAFVQDFHGAAKMTVLRIQGCSAGRKASCF